VAVNNSAHKSKLRVMSLACITKNAIGVERG
jgi:hypothetical protein